MMVYTSGMKSSLRQNELPTSVSATQVEGPKFPNNRHEWRSRIIDTRNSFNEVEKDEVEEIDILLLIL